MIANNPPPLPWACDCGATVASWGEPLASGARRCPACGVDVPRATRLVYNSAGRLIARDAENRVAVSFKSGRLLACQIALAMCAAAAFLWGGAYGVPLGLAAVAGAAFITVRPAA